MSCCEEKISLVWNIERTNSYRVVSVSPLRGHNGRAGTRSHGGGDLWGNECRCAELRSEVGGSHYASPLWLSVLIGGRLPTDQ